MCDQHEWEYAWSVVTSDGQQASEGDITAIYPLASVTKLIATWGYLIALEKSIITLTEPADPQGATIRHLFSHASGLPMDRPDFSPHTLPTEEANRAYGSAYTHTEYRPPARFVVDEDIRRTPGEKRIYSNWGMEIIGACISEKTGMPISTWLEEQVCAPLGMRQTKILGSPAYSGISNVHDLSLLAREFLTPTLISPMAAQAAHSVQFPHLSGILPGYGRQNPNEWGLGFEIRGKKNPHWLSSEFSPRTYGHFGQSGSFLWVDPHVKRAGVFLGNQPFGEKHKKLWPALTASQRRITLPNLVSTENFRAIYETEAQIGKTFDTIDDFLRN